MLFKRIYKNDYKNDCFKHIDIEPEELSNE